MIFVVGGNHLYLSCSTPFQQKKLLQRLQVLLGNKALLAIQTLHKLSGRVANPGTPHHTDLT